MFLLTHAHTCRKHAPPARCWPMGPLCPRGAHQRADRSSRADTGRRTPWCPPLLCNPCPCRCSTLSLALHTHTNHGQTHTKPSQWTKINAERFHEIHSSESFRCSEVARGKSHHSYSRHKDTAAFLRRCKSFLFYCFHSF